MNTLFALLLSLNLVTSSQSTTLSTSQQVTIAVNNNVTSQSNAVALTTQIYDPTEGRKRN